MDAKVSEEPDTIISRTEVSMAVIRWVMPVRITGVGEDSHIYKQMGTENRELWWASIHSLKEEKKVLWARHILPFDMILLCIGHEMSFTL
jgi:hypothetical protein